MEIVPINPARRSMMASLLERRLRGFIFDADDFFDAFTYECRSTALLPFIHLCPHPGRDIAFVQMKSVRLSLGDLVMTISIR